MGDRHREHGSAYDNMGPGASWRKSAWVNLKSRMSEGGGGLMTLGRQESSSDLRDRLG